jgi:phage-related protein
VGRTDIEDALKRLDKLTQDEVRMATAQLLKLTHGVDYKVTRIDDGVKSVDDKVKVVDDKVNGVSETVKLVLDGAWREIFVYQFRY